MTNNNLKKYLKYNNKYNYLKTLIGGDNEYVLYICSGINSYDNLDIKFLKETRGIKNEEIVAYYNLEDISNTKIDYDAIFVYNCKNINLSIYLTDIIKILKPNGILYINNLTTENLKYLRKKLIDTKNFIEIPINNKIS